MMLSLIAIATAILGFIGGSLWIFSAAVGFLILKMYPVLMIVLLVIGVGFLAIKYYGRW
jgi:hypothetical protein